MAEAKPNKRLNNKRFYEHQTNINNTLPLRGRNSSQPAEQAGKRKQARGRDPLHAREKEASPKQRAQGPACSKARPRRTVCLKGIHGDNGHELRKHRLHGQYH